MNLRNLLNLILGRPVSFIDPTARIGRDTTVWHWVTILAHVKIGKNCSIGSHAEIGAGTTIDDGSRISAHVFLPSNSTIGKCVFLGPCVCCTDDRLPFAGNADYIAEPPIIEDYASVGAGSVILPGVRIGKKAMIGAGSVVTRDVPAGGKVYGEKAKLRAMTFDHLKSEFGWIGGA